MKLWIKLALCSVLTVAAAASAAAVYSGFEHPDERETQQIEPRSLEGAQFVVREYDGCVAVFAAGESSPITMTDIDVRSLREYDRALLMAGLPAADSDEVLTLLEDLGS